MSDSRTTTRETATKGDIVGLKSRKSNGLALSVPFLLMTLTVAEGRAQVLTYRWEDRVVSAVTDRNAEADRLERRAAALHDEPTRYGEGAVLYERAAGLRQPDDPRKVDALFHASRLYYHAGRTQQSVAVLDRAAEAAVATGDVIRAVTLMTDAAWLLASEGRTSEASALVSRARLLTNSPLLNEPERNELRRRLGA
jgi:hypothetical protein